MAMIKINSKIEQSEWEALRAIADASHESIDEMLSEAIADYVRKCRLGPVVFSHLEDSIGDNEEFGKRLAK